MKGMLLLLVALAISAQTLDKYASEPIPTEYLTMVENEAHLNGYWWHNATATERQIYLMAWLDATGHRVAAGSVLYAQPGEPVPTTPPLIPRPVAFDLSRPVGEVTKLMNPDPKFTSGKGSADTNK
jgi:hypothetical protein